MAGSNVSAITRIVTGNGFAAIKRSMTEGGVVKKGELAELPKAQVTRFLRSVMQEVLTQAKKDGNLPKEATVAQMLTAAGLDPDKARATASKLLFNLSQQVDQAENYSMVRGERTRTGRLTPADLEKRRDNIEIDQIQKRAGGPDASKADAKTLSRAEAKGNNTLQAAVELNLLRNSASKVFANMGVQIHDPAQQGGAAQQGAASQAAAQASAS